MEKQQDNRDNMEAIWRKRFLAVMIASIAFIVLVLAVGCSYFITNKETIDADHKALSTFNEISATFINEFYADLENNPTVTEIYGYGVSPDGDFYIEYNLCEQSADRYVNCKDGKIYFLTDENGERVYSFSYVE